MESDGERFHCEWERGDLIGEGAFGSVFLAYPKTSSSSSSSSCLLPPVFAVKSAKISSSATLENELEVFNGLQSSPHILTCLSKELTVSSNNGETVYNLLVEYASGGSLTDHIKKSGHLLVEQVKIYTRQLLLGLARIHESGYVHCDIKPDNVLLAPFGDDFVAKIADFGLAKRRERKFDHVRGTSSYMAPETVVNGVQDFGSDIWAVGCVVYEMLTGHPVWQLDDNVTSDEIFHKIAGRRPCIDFGLPWEAKAFLRVCFERTAKYRPTAAMLLEHAFLTGLIEDKKEEEHVDEDCFGSEEEEEEVENGCEEGLDGENQKVADIGCEVEEDPEELEEAENGCEDEEEEEDPEEEELFGSEEEEEEIENGCEEELDSENQKVPEIGCEIEEDPEELEEAENGCEEEEEEDPEEEELFGSEEEEKEIENGCEEELDSENQKVPEIGCEIEDDPEELEEAENGCEEEEEEEDPEEEELFGSEEEEEEIDNGCEEPEQEEPENCRFFDFRAECSDSLFGSEEEEEIENGCEEELDNKNQKVAENGCEVEEDDPEEEIGSSYMFEDEWSSIPQEESKLVPCSLSNNDMTLPTSKRRKISHLNPITGDDLPFRTLAPTIAAGL